MDNRSTIFQSLAEERSLYFNAVAPPLLQTSNFAFDTVDSFSAALKDEYSTPLYSRGLNPTVDLLRKKLAELDGAADCLVVNSGSTAIFVSVLSQVCQGDHIIAVKGVYVWAQKLFTEILPRFGVTTTFVDGREIAHFEKALQPNTRVIYLESPTSWVMEEQDLRSIAALAGEKGVTTIIDNTYYTPLYQRPLDLGIDIAVQSASKYIGGHSDTIGGVISASSEIIRSIFRSEFLNTGAGIMPFNAWLLLRGLRTLPVRLEKIRQSTPAVLGFLRGHPAVEKILAPADAMGLFTIILSARHREPIVNFCEALQHMLMAVSWGGYESLVMPRCAALPSAEFNGNDELHRSVRLYIGLEDPQLIIADLQQALEKI